jgi:hypothetical protein
MTPVPKKRPNLLKTSRTIGWRSTSPEGTHIPILRSRAVKSCLRDAKLA